VDEPESLDVTCEDLAVLIGMEIRCRYTVKKRLAIFPSPAGISITKLYPGPGIITLFPSGGWEKRYLFYSVHNCGF
jgi:hypothetical protein